MELINQIIYPAGETYYGEATEEIDHFEFLKTYSLDSAIGNMFSAIEQAASQQGFVLLRTEIYYDGNDLLYHLFDVKYYFVQITPAGYAKPTIAPVAILLYIVAGIIVGIVGYILFRSFNISVNSIQYEPTGPGGQAPAWSPFSYAIVFIGAAMLLNAFTGASKRFK